MPKFHQKSLFYFLFALLIFTAFTFSQIKPSENLSPNNPTLLEINDEQLLTFLLSERTQNLHQWGAVTQFHGLPSDRVNTIAQTADGILWFGTDLGLAKFDGRRVQTVGSEDFSNKRIFILKTDSEKNLWIGTEKGAFRFINNGFQLIPNTGEFAIKSIIFTENNRTFLASDDGKVFEVSFNESKMQSQLVATKRFKIESLGNKDENIFFGTENEGLFQSSINDFDQQNLANRITKISTIEKDAKGDLWIGGNGLFFAESPLVPKQIGGNLGTVNSLAFETGENLWVGTNGNGAFLFRGVEQKRHFTFENTAGGLRSNEIYATFVDRENVIWFGTNKGVSRFDPNSPFSEKFSSDLNSKFIRTLFQAKDGKVYAGTQRGLFVSATAGEWQKVVGFEKNTIYSIAENSDGKLLFGTPRKLLFSNQSSVSADETETSETSDSENQTPSGSIRTIENFRGRTFFAVFGQGLSELVNSTFSAISGNTNETRNIISLKSDGDKKLWFGTAESGVFVFDGERIFADARFSELKNKAVWEIEGSEEKGLWFGTEKGLFLFQNGELQTILPETDVRAVVVSEDSKAVWCATEKDGLMRLVFDEEFGWMTSRLDVEQGFPSQKIFSLLKLPDETLLIGTNRGVVRYKTPDTKPILIPTRIVSRRLHSVEELKSNITLEYPQNTLTVEVAAISSRTFPEQFQYAFTLRDDKNKTLQKKFSKDSQFLPDDLTAGNYTVEIRAFDKNLIASEPLTFTFSVEKSPFPWITLLLSVLLLIALAALIWAIFSQRKIFQKNTELKQARFDLANEAERERRRISRDLHDQTLADLRHLQLLTDKDSTNGDTPVNVREEIENISTEIRRICEDLSPSVLENIGFSAALEWALSNENKFEYEFICPENFDENLPLSSSEQIQIYRIVQEVLSNISRHAEAAKVKLSVEISLENLFLLTIEDNGKSFDFDNTKIKKGRGLSNIKSRAALVDAKVFYRKGENGGTVFTLSKNLNKNVEIHS